jgi:hypothetical protein
MICDVVNEVIEYLQQSSELLEVIMGEDEEMKKKRSRRCRSNFRVTNVTRFIVTTISA